MGFRLKILDLLKDGNSIVVEYQVLEDTEEVYDSGVVYRHRFPNERHFFEENSKGEVLFKKRLMELITHQRKHSAVKGDLRKVRPMVDLSRFKDEELSIDDES